MKIDRDAAKHEARLMLNDAEEQLKRGCDKVSTLKYEANANLTRDYLALENALKHALDCEHYLVQPATGILGGASEALRADPCVVCLIHREVFFGK